MAGREKKIGAFLPISDMRVQRPSIFFETKNIFIFGAGPNFGRGQKRGFTLVWRFFPDPNWGPKTPKNTKKSTILALEMSTRHSPGLES